MVSAQTWAEIRLWGSSGALAAALFPRATRLGDNANERRARANDGERGARGEDTEAGDREGDGAKKAGEGSEHDIRQCHVSSPRDHHDARKRIRPEWGARRSLVWRAQAARSQASV